MPRYRWITRAELEGRPVEWGQPAAESEFPDAFADPALVLTSERPATKSSSS